MVVEPICKDEDNCFNQCISVCTAILIFYIAINHVLMYILHTHLYLSSSENKHSSNQHVTATYVGMVVHRM